MDGRYKAGQDDKGVISSELRIIFDLAGDKYRVVVHVAYRFGRVQVTFVGTHKEYDRIKPETV